MSSRRFTAQCLRASTEKDSTTGGSAAVRDFKRPNRRYGSWLCENSSTRRARRNISKKLRIMESNDAARAMFDTLLENCIFYISPMYEFLHSHQRPKRSTPHYGACPLHPEADVSKVEISQCSKPLTGCSTVRYGVTDAWLSHAIQWRVTMR